MTLRRRFAGLVTLTSFVSSQLAPGLVWAQDRTSDAERYESAAPLGRGAQLPSTPERRLASERGASSEPLGHDYDLPARRLSDEDVSRMRMERAPRDPDRSAEPADPGDDSPEPDGPVAEPATLPSGEDKSGVTSQAISLPKGAGTIQGMEESFSAQLSTGIATFSVPFALPRARGGAQPSLGLSYSSASGRGAAGQGWSLGVPFIARQTDRGLPKYDDRSSWHLEQDRFVFNGGQELVPICTVGSDLGCRDNAGRSRLLEGEVMPAWASGHQYFRARVEGSFLRFFWAPNHKTWRVQDKSGVTMELGVPLDGSGDEAALDKNPQAPREIYRWHLVRQYDVHGATQTARPEPVNVVVYKYFQSGSQAYLSDIFDTTPAAEPTTTDLSQYAHHTRIFWEPRTDPTESYRSGWLMEDSFRVQRVEVASKTFQEGASGPRRRVRRYHLSYRADSHLSLLSRVQVEGRCAGDEISAPVEGSGGTNPSCQTLPPMTFEYTSVAPFRTDGSPSSRRLPGFEPFDERIRSMGQSPNHSVDEQLADLFDINADGLPDVLVTAPGLYGNGHAAFFNGAGGRADRFGTATPMGVSGGVAGTNAGTITLRNLNVTALDADGDGRIDLLHMPLTRRYAVFTPRQVGGNWSWWGREIDTASGQSPQINFTGDALDTQVLDVDFDGLVDVVVSAGTQYKTFFSLGRYPGGDGQFGFGRHTSTTTSSINNNPVTACVPHSGSPVRFSDPDIKLADMNGDGIVDIVRIRRGDIRYWPGRGNGFWGTGRRDDCGAGSFGANRHVTMNTAPWYSDIQETTLRMDDVNGDGLADLVQVRFNAVDIWLNVDGRGWTERHIIENTPASPSYANRVRLADINGTGTRSILWGNAGNYRYIDLQGGQRPWLLTKVENGLGKSTEIEYSTSTAEMLAAEARATSGGCSDAAPWCSPWSRTMPTVAHVVKRVTEKDNITIAGRPPAAYVTEYEYRDPVYEGRQREFRGFERARARRIGDANSPTDVSESTFLLGECRDPATGTAWDGASLAHYCAPPSRWRDNPFEALKGLPIVTEQRNEGSVYLSTTHNGYRIRTLYQGLDGRAVRHAFLEETDTFLYDIAGGTASQGAAEVLASVVDEDHGGGAIATSVPVRRPAGHAQLRSTVAVDLFGNRLRADEHGCVAGDACPVAGNGIAAEEVVSQITEPTMLDHDSGWLWRTAESWVEGSAHATRRNHTLTHFDDFGRPERTDVEVIGTLSLDRAVSASLPSGGTVDGMHVQSTVAYDAFGNPVRSRSANGRCTEVLYDGGSEGYALFATAEEIFTADSGAVTAIGTPCAGASLSTGAAYDRGFGVVTDAVDFNLRPTSAEYDGFGRIVALFKTDPATQVLGAFPSVQIAYFLPGDPGSTPGARHSIIHTRSEDGEQPGDGEYLESFAYVDGFGRTLATLTEADTSEGDGAGNDGDAWIAGELTEWDAKSAVAKKYLEFFFNGDPMAFNYGARPLTAYGRQRYDAFGRQVQTYDLDGTVTLQSFYHALSTDLWDAADLTPGPHHSTFVTERHDGHGRTIAVTERFRAHGSIEQRDVRTMYLPTGEPEVITRVRVGFADSPVVRWMRYDSIGRMVLNAEPNTTDGFVGPEGVLDPQSTPPQNMQAWRYAYDDAGDLIGTSDARGCGQNFYYDGAGRITGEDYAPCEAHHAPYTSPGSDGSSLAALEVVYVYDSVAAIPGGVATGATCSGGDTLGHVVAVLDRASVSLPHYDARGRLNCTSSRVSRPKELAGGTHVAAAAAISDRYAPRWYSHTMEYDAADREAAVSTGAESLRDENDQALAELLAPPNGESKVTTSYSRRGTVQAVGSSYGSLITRIDRTADGLVKSLVYGDAARTTTAYLYDERRRISSVQTYRGPPASWESPPQDYQPPPAPGGTDTTFQLLLQDEDFRYDVVGNPIEIRDWRNPAEWSAGAKPATRRIQYDDLYRAKRIDYSYASGDDAWTSPFADEVANGGEATDGRRAPPSPHVSFEKRVLHQTFEYDWLGNTSKSGDDARGFYDRSLGDIENAVAGTPGVTEAKPYQLHAASNVAGTPDGREGELWTKYDASGNLTRLDVRRYGPCLPSGDCSQRFEYRWDEVGRLERARRWDTTTGLGDVDGGVPVGNAAADLRYAYDASDQRILKEAVDAGGASSHTVYLFATLELRRASFGAAYGVGTTEDYEVSRWTAVLYLLANGVRFARLAYEESTVPSRDPQQMDPEEGGVNASSSQVHVFFELGDHLGSTSVVLDKATSELVERSTFLGYGATESDYRPERWEGFREDYKFTGKEEDVEVGLQYFGKRFLNAYLGRWVSADPLAVHAPGEADFNLYAYVRGTVLKNVDPVGFEEIPAYNWIKAKSSHSIVTVAEPRPADPTANAIRHLIDRFATDNYAGKVYRTERGPELRMHTRLGASSGLADTVGAVREAVAKSGLAPESVGNRTVSLAVGHGNAVGSERDPGADFSGSGDRIFLTDLKSVRKIQAAERDGLPLSGEPSARLLEIKNSLEAIRDSLAEGGVSNFNLLGCRVGTDGAGQDYANELSAILSTDDNQVRVGLYENRIAAREARGGGVTVGLVGPGQANELNLYQQRSEDTVPAPEVVSQ